MKWRAEPDAPSRGPATTDFIELTRTPPLLLAPCWRHQATEARRDLAQLAAAVIGAPHDPASPPRMGPASGGMDWISKCRRPVARGPGAGAGRGRGVCRGGPCR